MIEVKEDKCTVVTIHKDDLDYFMESHVPDAYRNACYDTRCEDKSYTTVRNLSNTKTVILYAYHDIGNEIGRLIIYVKE
jgi:hypothetical protein